MPDSNVEILRKETYLKSLENSVGSKIFNSLFVRYKDSRVVNDILGDGELSCAAFVTGMLFLSNMIDRQRATVKSTDEYLMQSQDWKKVSIEEIEPGDVIVWEKITFDTGSQNAHIGFAAGNGEAISTNYKQKAVDRHHITSGLKENGKPARAIEAAYRFVGIWK